MWEVMALVGLVPPWVLGYLWFPPLRLFCGQQFVLLSPFTFLTQRPAPVPSGYRQFTLFSISFVHFFL